MSRSEMSRSFGRAADDYERGRPSYLPDAVTWLLAPGGPGPLEVLDIGAGTGKLTGVAVGLGHRVTALEPDPVMLETLARNLPDVPTLVGAAENLPAADGTFDAAIAGQAWHWVEPEAASAEVGRVLRPGGVLGLVWNTRDTSVPWVARMTEIMHLSRAEEYIEEDENKVARPFGDLERATFEWSRTMTRTDLFAMAHSRSYVITADPETRARIDSGLGDLFDELGLDSEDATVDLPYLTHAFRTLKSG